MYEKSSVRRRIGGLILAAGLSSRMGDFKPLMPLRGKTFIENTIDSLLLCGIHSVTVVLGYRGREVEYEELEPMLNLRKASEALFDYEYEKGDIDKAFAEADKLPYSLGAKGCGELCIIPTAPACAHAYYRLDGKFRQSLPLSGTPYRK